VVGGFRAGCGHAELNPTRIAFDDFIADAGSLE
jgi:hypothetical protein